MLKPDLIIYKEYVELINYTNMIIKKYPKSERFDLVSEIKKHTYKGLECILYAYKVYERKNKLRILNDLDVELKILKVLIMVSYKNRYISNNNINAWSRKLENIGNLLGGWINACLKQ